MWQQLLDSAGGLREQVLEHVLQVGIRIVLVEPRRLHEAHDSRGTFAGTQAPGEQPVAASDGNRLVILPISGK